MQKSLCICGVLLVVSVSGPWACQRAQRQPPPPDARRPEIRSAAELAAEREARIRSGEVVPTSAPALLSPARATTSRPAPPPPPPPNAIAADILIVNSTVLTIPEILYPLRPNLEEIRRTRTRTGFMDEARRLIRRRVQEEIGSVLIYAEAVAKLQDDQKKSLDASVDKEVAGMLAREFEGSEAKLDAHLREYGLTREQFRSNVKRSLVVRQYTREKMMPQVQIRRDELLAEYRRNIARYSTPATRELLLIELPFEKFLPEGLTWVKASPPEKAAAKLKAMRQAREAHAALAQQSFADVARAYSLGLHADTGGSWGMLGRPLQAPYDQLSKRAFEFSSGQVSEPIETDTGWYIVGCGAIEPEQQRSFAEVQDQIRAQLMEKRFSRLSADYVVRLAEKATITSLEPFVAAALRRADQLTAVAAR